MFALYAACSHCLTKTETPSHQPYVLGAVGCVHTQHTEGTLGD